MGWNHQLDEYAAISNIIWIQFYSWSFSHFFRMQTGFTLEFQAAGPLRTANEEVDFAGAKIILQLDFFWGEVGIKFPEFLIQVRKRCCKTKLSFATFIFSGCFFLSWMWEKDIRARWVETCFFFLGRYIRKKNTVIRTHLQKWSKMVGVSYCSNKYPGIFRFLPCGSLAEKLSSLVHRSRRRLCLPGRALWKYRCRIVFVLLVVSISYLSTWTFQFGWQMVPLQGVNSPFC